MKYLVILLLLIGVAYGQGNVKSAPQTHDGIIIYGDNDPAQSSIKINDYDVLGKYGDGADTSSAFSVHGWSGAVCLWVAGDTSCADSAVDVSNTSDSCLTVRLQLKDPDFGWGGLYSETTTNYTTLDTVSRALINAANDIFLYIPLAEETAWAPADSARFIFVIATGDTLPFKAKIGDGSQ